jgi:hypothetical protein
MLRLSLPYLHGVDAYRGIAQKKGGSDVNLPFVIISGVFV